MNDICGGRDKFKKIFQGAVKYMSDLVKNNRDLRTAALNEFKSFKPEAAIKKYAESLTNKTRFKLIRFPSSIEIRLKS